MRTTLTLEGDAFELARRYARARDLKLGQAVSELIRLSTMPPIPMVQRDGLWIFDPPPDTPRVTAAQVKAMLDELP